MTKGERIKSARKSLGLSQELLAKKISVTKGAISQWENDITIASAESYLSISEATGYSHRWLVRGLGPEAEESRLSEEHKEYLENCTDLQVSSLLASITARLTNDNQK